MEVNWRKLWERTIGMRLALWLDKRHPDWCWAALCVDLGLGWDIRGAMENAESSGPRCKRECGQRYLEFLLNFFRRLSLINFPHQHPSIGPKLIGDFSRMQFADESFSLVVFDPPHLARAGGNGWQAKKYGKLPKEWRELIGRGFSECFRVLRPNGVIAFKWNEHEIAVSQILALTPERPLFGQRCGKSAKTHWIVFMKSEVR